MFLCRRTIQVRLRRMKFSSDARINCVRIKNNLINEEEERVLLQYLDKIFSRKRYEKNHFDSVISAYKETELLDNNLRPTEFDTILKRVSEYVLRVSGVKKLISPHVIDLDVDGVISPHVDSVKFSGGLIAGLSLNSTRMMRLCRAEVDPVAISYNDSFDFSSISTVNEDGISVIPLDSNIDSVNIELPPRSIYFLQGPSRYLCKYLKVYIFNLCY